MDALGARDTGAAPARHEDREDLERLIATIQAIKAADAAKAPACAALLAKLTAHRPPQDVPAWPGRHAARAKEAL